MRPLARRAPPVTRPLASTPPEPRTAGRELDALVAEKVMGLSVSWRSLHPNPDASDPPEIYLLDDKGDMPLLEVRSGDGWTFLPRYSTDITAAWQVVERMKERGYWLCLIQNQLLFSASFDSVLTDHRATGETAPHAICLAALESAHD